MIDMFEINLRSSIKKEEIFNILYSYFNISQNKIGPDNDFFERIGTNNELIIGYSIYYSLEGYETFINFHYNGECSNIIFLKLCMQMSTEYNTEVAIGDISDDGEDSTGKYLVIFPDKTYQKAYEESNGDVFEVKPYTEKTDISELIEIVQAHTQ